MADIFVSYGRSTEAQAQQVAEALRAAGYSVWRDDELPAHRAYSEVIEERLRSAKAVVVLWSAEAARSQWVRAEADIAREAGTLVQVTVDGTLPPIPFNQIQCAVLDGWSGDTSVPGWQKVESSISLLVGSPAQPAQPETKGGPTKRVAILVLPFINMSGDAEQEYFSDGITDDIITDLSKVSALSIVARNTAFTFKGQTLDVVQLARQLNVTHVLEGSIRKSGDRVRINAQLINGEAGDHVWADRYDRDLTDIFAIQDEISKAIVSALRLKLLPKEKKAIETRGTSSVEAYNLYLMARQHWISGNDGDIRRDEVVVRIARQATEIDPGYAKAWALIALAQAEMRFRHSRSDVDALASAERALELDPDLPEALCVKARYLADEDGKPDEAHLQIHTALRLDPDSWEVNKEAARLLSRSGKMREAIPFFEKAAALVDTDYHSSGMLQTCYAAVDDPEGLKRAAHMTLDRTQRVLAQDPSIGSALGFGAVALAALGEGDRAKEWIRRALLMDPDNLTMRWNLACSLSRYLGDKDAAIELLATFVDRVPLSMVKYLRLDTDLDPLRNDARFEELAIRAEQRVSAAKAAPATAGAVSAG